MRENSEASVVKAVFLVERPRMRFVFWSAREMRFCGERSLGRSIL